MTDPTAALADVARAAGIGRTTLHKLYPTRHALLVALARDALDLLETVYADAGLADPGAAVPALRRLVRDMIPLGPRLEFLLRERSLDVEADLTARLEALDEPVRALVRRAQADGALRPDVTDDWVVASLNALVYAAWELVALGRVASVAAPDLVLDTLLHGTATRPQAVEAPTRPPNGDLR